MGKLRFQIAAPLGSAMAARDDELLVVLLQELLGCDVRLGDSRQRSEQTGKDDSGEET